MGPHGRVLPQGTHKDHAARLHSSAEWVRAVVGGRALHALQWLARQAGVRAGMPCTALRLP